MIPSLFQTEELTLLSPTVRVLTEPLESMAHPNFENRTLYTADNLDVMRGMNSESVDLIATDPPFNSKKNYAAALGTKAAGAEFRDTWSLDDVKKEWVEDLQSDNTATWSAITAAGYIHGESSQAYLTYMAIRLLEMRRVLKFTGSIYLHCDPTMGHYLKTLMDAIFGRTNFRNEIIWCYTSGGVSKRWFGKKHDVVFFYSKSNEYNFNVQYRPYSEGTVQRGLTQYEKRLNEEYRLREEGAVENDWWMGIQPVLSPTSKERQGYPTQKPLKLYRRIIQASSNEGDMILDPFCGCATTCIAAEVLGRQWVGIDVEEKARELVVGRLRNEVYRTGFLEGTQRLDKMPHIYHLRRPPKRTDPNAPQRSKNIKRVLYERQKVRCNGICGRVLDIDLFEIDHIVPRSKGGSDMDDNLQLLCSTCNRKKGSKTMARFLELMEGE